MADASCERGSLAASLAYVFYSWSLCILTFSVLKYSKWFRDLPTIVFYCTDCCFCYNCDIGILRIHVGFFVPVLCAHIRHWEWKLFCPCILGSLIKKRTPVHCQYLYWGGGGADALLVLNYQEFSPKSFSAEWLYRIIAYDVIAFYAVLRK